MGFLLIFVLINRIYVLKTENTSSIVKNTDEIRTLFWRKYV